MLPSKINKRNNMRVVIVLLLTLVAFCSETLAFSAEPPLRRTLSTTTRFPAAVRSPTAFLEKTPQPNSNAYNHPRSDSRLYVSSSSNNVDDDEKSWKFNPVFGALAAALFSYAFVLTPGEFGGPADTELLNAVIADPIHPQGIPELFMVVFNFLGLMPFVMASVIIPQSSKRGLPAGFFTVLSGAAGFFGLSPYLMFRAPPVQSKTKAEMAWFSRNVLENKLYSWAVVALIFSVPFATGAVDACTLNLESQLSGYAQLVATTKFASVSTADLATLTIALALLIPQDYALRCSSSDEVSEKDIKQKGTLIAVSTLFLPILGGALYAALRPSLEEE